MHKNRFINRYTILSFILLFVISLLSWEVQDHYIWSFLTFKDSPEFTREYYLSNMFGFDFFIIDGFSFLQLLLPLIVSVSVMNFVDEKKGLFSYAYSRMPNYRKFIITSMLEHAGISALVLSCSYFFYCMLGLLITDKEFYPDAAMVFEDIFGKDFYINHLVLYYILEGILKYVVFPIVYSLFTMAIAFYTDKKYMIVSVPTAYYIVLTLLFVSLNNVFENVPVLKEFDFRILAPDHPITFQTMEAPSTALIGVAYIPVIAFVAFTLTRSFKEGEKIGV